MALNVLKMASNDSNIIKDETYMAQNYRQFLNFRKEIECFELNEY
jgi:hypothetical protein